MHNLNYTRPDLHSRNMHVRIFRRFIVDSAHSGADYNGRSRSCEINYACIQSTVSLWAVSRNIEKVNCLGD